MFQRKEVGEGSNYFCQKNQSVLTTSTSDSKTKGIREKDKVICRLSLIKDLT